MVMRRVSLKNSKRVSALQPNHFVTRRADFGSAAAKMHPVLTDT
jgi:hypothetical protein